MTHPPELGAARGPTLDERRAIIEAHIELALATVKARLETGWIDQAHSPLGKRVHVDAVRRRLSERRRDAAIRGRRFLLTIDAIADEYFRTPHEARRALARFDRAAPASNDNGGRH
jgi:hypothetical protein